MLSELHTKHIVYRDLKPENLVVCKNTGRVCLVDFGFAKDLHKIGRTFTKCGTPGYSAPEILLQVDEDTNELKRRIQKLNSVGYSYPCDVWSWGVLLCELTGGCNPFSSGTKSITEIFDNILNVRVNWPRKITFDCKELLKRVFERESLFRITIPEIKKHPFFNVSPINKQSRESTG